MAEKTNVGPLKGLKVIDLTQVLSGPFATMWLATMGAEVIKIENPKSPDVTRNYAPFQNGVSAYFPTVNHNKKCITLNLKAPEGKELSSEAFATKLADVKNSGKSSACFLIGSSFGMSPRVKSKADFKLSMGPMTFPHHLARIMVLEQIYRAEAIQAGSKYHK